jgi:hypothetical protein
MIRFFHGFYSDSNCIMLSFNRSMQLVSIFKIMSKSACLSHQGYVSSARFTSALLIVPSQAAVSIKSDSPGTYGAAIG